MFLFLFLDILFWLELPPTLTVLPLLPVTSPSEGRMRGPRRTCAVLALPGGAGCGGAGVYKRGDMSSGGGEVAAVPASGAANGLSNGAGGAPAQTSNPLSRKLHKILETRLDNDKVAGADPGRGRGLSGIQSPHPLR